MTVQDIHTMLDTPEYEFLRSNDHLRDKIMLLTLGGSHAYGTNVETSDVDIRGCAKNSPSDILGLTNFEQLVDNQTDTTVYSFNKLVQLLINCNPNTIEMLGCKPEHYFFISPEGRQMIDNAHLFLSLRAVKAFGGYATQQLRRLENAIARDKLPQSKKEQHMLGAMKRAREDVNRRYIQNDEGFVRLYIEDSDRDEFDSEIFADIHLTRIRARDFSSIMNEFSNVMETYDSNRRNKKKDSAHLNKHAMHLIRLYLMCLDILEKEKVITYREKDLDLLMSIRRGEYMREDGTYRDEFFQMVSDFENRVRYAKENSSLPENPDMKKLQEFVMDINRRSI